MIGTLLLSRKLHKERRTGWDSYALCIWMCDNCERDVSVLEVAGENWQPKFCPHCRGTTLHWERAYAADVNGRVTE